MQILLTFSHIYRSSAFLFRLPFVHCITWETSSFRPLYRLRGGPFLFFLGNPIARSFSALPLLIQNKEGVPVLDTPPYFLSAVCPMEHKKS